MRKRNRVFVIGTKGLDNKYGGFETFVRELVSFQNEFTIIVFSEGKRRNISRKENNVIQFELPISATGPMSIIYDIYSIIISLKLSTAKSSLLILGTSGGIFFPLIKYFNNSSKIITNIAGLEWSRSKWSFFTRIFLKLSEKLCIKNSSIVVTDNMYLKKYVLEEYKVNSVFIPYGGDQYENIASECPDKSFPRKFDFAIARAQPDNNLEMMLDAYLQAPYRNILLCSNWDDRDNFSKKIKEKYSKQDNIFLIGPIYKKSYLKFLYTNCEYYVHGHSAGGTNPTLVEAMHNNCKIIAYNNGYNNETTNQKVAYFDSTDDLVMIINDKNQLQGIPTLRNYAKSNYKWSKIAKQYFDIFK